jgi:hypothetical protein
MQKGGQEGSQGMNDQVRRVWRAGAEIQHGQKLGARIAGHPQPQHLWSAAQPGAQARPVGGVGARDGGSSARARSVRAVQHGSERLVIVDCREPKTRSAAEGSSPSASAESTMATCCEGVFKRYKGVSRRAVNVVRHAGPRKVWICSARPGLPSPTRAWTRGSGMPTYRHGGFGQAKPSVFTRLGAPRRLVTSHQGRTDTGVGPPLDVEVEPRRQAGQSSGLRGFRRR